MGFASKVCIVFKNSHNVAEQQLQGLHSQQGFPLLLMKLISDESVDRPVRLSGSILLKNYVKKEWDETNMNDTDRSSMKTFLVPLMVSASGVIQKQLSEVVSIMAADFYHKWSTLIAVRLFYIYLT